MTEARMQQHLPDGGVAPVLGGSLRVNPNSKVVMTALHTLLGRVLNVEREAHQVLTHSFEGIIEG